MFPVFDFQNSYTFSRNIKLIKILSVIIGILGYIKNKLDFSSGKSYASGDNNPKRKPAVLNIDSVTVFWIVAAFLFIPLVLTGLLSH